MIRPSNYAVVVPMANEEKDFDAFTNALGAAIAHIPQVTVYLVVDDASKDRTKLLAEKLAAENHIFNCIYAPENKNVVDAYLRGYKEAFNSGHDFIVEMDAGLSHDPATLPEFFLAYQQGYDCVFGSRFKSGGTMQKSSIKRRMLSKGGTLISNLLLGTRLSDMTSGYQGFSAKITEKIIQYPLLSKAHFYQTELRYLLRKQKGVEIPITYQTPSPGVKSSSVTNALSVLLYYFRKRLIFQTKEL